MPSLCTRLATAGDLPQAAALFDAYRQFYEQAPDLPAATAFIAARLERGDSVILVAEDGTRQLLGFSQLYPTFCSIEARPIYTLSDLFVTPEGRRRGAGRQLLLAAEAHAGAQGMARMELTTARTNLPAQTLYESLGWRRDEVYHAYNKRVGA